MKYKGWKRPNYSEEDTNSPEKQQIDENDEEIEGQDCKSKTGN